MPLNAGTRLGPYEIVAKLGEGGMGEVYKATDTRLSRTIAIKVLPPHWIADAEMKQRFEREAQTVASLNHPNICVLHDIGSAAGVDFLVMEFLGGETLADRLKRGPVPIDEALEIGIGIADALDKAHRQNVVHRDLKPSNVMLTESGPKLLDFGLAKTDAMGTPAGVAAGRSGLTMPGTLIGTLQYMAPEQLEGGDADARTDIFALGVLLHEMISGKKLFEGKSRVLLMSAIATIEAPPLSAAEPATPPGLEHVVRTCLAKDPADRWQTARDLLAELQAIAAGADEGFVTATSAARNRPSRLPRVLAAVALAAGVAVSVPACYHLQGAAPPDELRFRVPIQLSAEPNAIPLPPVATGQAFRHNSFAVSPNGRWIAMVISPAPGDPAVLFVRPVGGLAPQLIPRTEDVSQPFWSADSRQIGFVVSGKLKKVDASGGQPEEICAVTDFSGGSWNADGTILFGSTRGLFRVSAQGGKPELVTKLEEAEAGHFWPHFLPDGQHYLFTVWGQPAARGIFVGTLGSPEKKRVLSEESNAMFVIGAGGRGFLLFQRDKAVFAKSFDPAALVSSGEDIRVADDVTSDSSNGRGYFTSSIDGVLAYFQNLGTSAGAGAQSDAAEWHLAWTSRSGQTGDTPGPSAVYRGFEWEPVTKRIVAHRHEPAGGDVWVLEPTGAETRLTWDASQHNASPIWSPDGKSIVFSSTRNGKPGLYRKPSDGSGVDELLFESDLQKAPMSWSPDAKHIVFGVQDQKTGADLWVLSVEDKKATPFPTPTSFTETHAQISPDGRWLAYASDSVGGRREIHVQAFPSGAGHWQVSNAGGDWPRWRKDGKELFYHSIGPLTNPSVVGPMATFGPLYAVSVDGRGTAFVSGAPYDVLVLRALGFPHPGGDYHTYAVAPDGQSFLYLQLMPTGTTPTGATGPDPSSGLVVAMNWAPRLKK